MGLWEKVRGKAFDEWPEKETAQRIRGPFREARFQDTVYQLTREIRMINGKDPLLLVGLGRNDFRLDGAPRAQAKTWHPGVILELRQSDCGPLRFPCDRFLHWQDNLRAIALAMHDLRRIRRYGIGVSSEQYRGFAALPQNAGDGVPGMTDAMAIDIIAGTSGEDTAAVMHNQVIRERAFHTARKKSHPDAGGDASRFNIVSEAGRHLGLCK